MQILNKISLLCILLFCSMSLSGQNTKRVLFLGNSYTYVNDMPYLVSKMAESTGKKLIYSMNAPGGYYIAQHLTDTVSLKMIEQGNWDNVVLQDQSLSLAYPSTYLNFFPYSVKMDSVIKLNNPCAQTMFYVTWGRKNGDTYLCNVPECSVNTWITRSYYQMDSTIESHYRIFADSIKASMSPVGAIWRYLRQNYPSTELFQSDESHPSLEGSYASACSFYTAIFRSDPSAITFNPGIAAMDAANIRSTVKLVVYDNLPKWNVGVYDFLLDSSCVNAAVDTGKYWNIFPNPVTDILSIRFSEYNINNKIAFYNIFGMLIKEMQIGQTAEINIEDFSSGVYIIRSADNQHLFKVIKK